MTTILYPTLPYFQRPVVNVMAVAWAIRNRKAEDWQHRLIPRDEWMRAALRQAWDARHDREREYDRRMACYGHLLYMPKDTILSRRGRLWETVREAQYYSRLSLTDHDAALAELEVIERHVLPNI